MLRNKRIVVIDDTESIRNFLRISLEANNAIVHTAATAAGGLALCEQEIPDVVVLDIGLPDNEGLNILPRIKRLRKDAPPKVMVLTVRKEQAFIERAKTNGADAARFAHVPVATQLGTRARCVSRRVPFAPLYPTFNCTLPGNWRCISRFQICT